MRKIKYEEVIRRKKDKLFLMDRTKKIRRKPRNKEEEKVLDILLNAKLEKLFKNGMIKKVGKRKFILKI